MRSPCSETGDCLAPSTSSARGAAVHREADRAGRDVCRPGRDRHREHAAVRGRAGANQGADRVAGAADGDVGGAAGHLQLARRAGAGVPRHAGECDAHLRGQVRRPVSATKDDAFRAVAMHGAPPALAEDRRRDPVIRPGPPTGLGGRVRTKQAVHIADVRRSPPISKGIPSLGDRRTLAVRGPFLRADAQGGRSDRRVRHLPSGGATVHRQADRSGHKLRQPGRHRHRERAPVQRDQGGPGAADRDRRDSQGDLELAQRYAAGVRRHRRERTQAVLRVRRISVALPGWRPGEGRWPWPRPDPGLAQSVADGGFRSRSRATTCTVCAILDAKVVDFPDVASGSARARAGRRQLPGQRLPGRNDYADVARQLRHRRHQRGAPRSRVR